MSIVARLLLGTVAAAVSVACSFIVESEGPLACSQEGQLGPPACDSGLVCRGGLCQAPAAGAGGASPDGGRASVEAAGAAGWGGAGSP